MNPSYNFMWLNCLRLHTISLEIAIYAGIILFLLLNIWKILASWPQKSK
jgi:hypothetical protein